MGEVWSNGQCRCKGRAVATTDFKAQEDDGMKMDVMVDGARMTVKISGRLDVHTAPVLDELIEHQLANIKELMLDCGGVDSVSSVGLRAILKAHQKMKDSHGRLLLKNVTKSTADVFEVTGLDRILHCERKPRSMSVAGLQMIAKGANGECYKVDDETVLKLYFDYVEEAYAVKEKELAKQAFVAGVPTPISFDVVACGDRRGILYEMIRADTLSKYIETNVDRFDEVVELYVGFCKKIHAIVPAPNTFPDAVTLACGYVDACDFFNERQRAFLKDRLVRTERHGTLIHWDLHPSNIMRDGENLCLIDMGDMAVGTPFFDLGQIKHVLHYCGGMGLCHTFIGLSDAIAVRVWKKFVASYFGHPAPDALAVIEENIEFYRAIKNVFLYLCRSGGETMRSRRKEFIFQMLPKEFAQLR